MVDAAAAAAAKAAKKMEGNNRGNMFPRKKWSDGNREGKIIFGGLKTDALYSGYERKRENYDWGRP